MLAMSAFRETTVRFRNAASVRVREIRIDSSPIALLLQACRDLFYSLDRNDPFQASLSRKLWEFRASILYTLMPFDSIELGLAKRFQLIMDDALLVPGAIDGAEGLAQGMEGLIKRQINPKHLWLKESMDEAARLGDSHTTGLVTMMAMGQPFGWPLKTEGSVELPASVRLIDSHKTIASMVFDKIIVPGTCHYLTSRMYSEIFHLGRTNEVDVLLYPGERFSLRDRLKLPEDRVFRGHLAASRVVHSSDVIRNSDDGIVSDIDDQMKRSLWDMAHSGQRNSEPGLIPARYVLCKDGRGMFVRENTHMLIWIERTEQADSAIESVPIEQVAEGDWLVMRPGDTGRLLDLVSAEAGFGKKMETVCDWRPALEALMLTYSADQIAREMLADGAHGVSLAQSICNWADGTVYGPGTPNELRSLINILISHRKLPKPDNLDQYIMDHWTGLRELRGIRLRAGMSLHNSIQSQLANALLNHVQLSENQTVKLENGMLVQLMQVAALDDQISWVHASNLMHLQTMRGGRWQR